MIDKVQKSNSISKTSSMNRSGSGGASSVNISQLAAAQKQRAQMRAGGAAESKSSGSGNPQIAQIKGEIALLYKQIEDGLKNSPGPNAVSQSPWSEGPVANQATGQIEKAQALIRVKQEKIKAIESAEKEGKTNSPAFNDLMNTYNQMEDMAKLQDFNPSYDGFNSPKMTTNSYVGDQMFKLRNLAELHKAEMANNS